MQPEQVADVIPSKAGILIVSCPEGELFGKVKSIVTETIALFS